MQYEIRAMSFAEILDTALQIIRNHFVLLVGLAAILYLPYVLVEEWLTPALPQAGEELSPAESAGFMSSVLAMFGASLLILSILWPVAVAAVNHAIGELYVGRQATFGGSVNYAISVLLPLVGTWLLASLIIGVGFLLLVLPGIYVMLCLMLLWPIMVVERMYGAAAMRRSRDLMRDNLMRGFGIALVSGLLITILGSAASMTLNFIPIVNVVAPALVQSVGMAYGAAAMMVLYFDIRCRKEGFDIDHLASLVERQGVVAAPTP